MSSSCWQKFTQRRMCDHEHDYLHFAFCIGRDLPKRFSAGVGRCHRHCWYRCVGASRWEKIMIIKKTWIVDRRGEMYKPRVRYYYTGWFLLGIIPLYMSRVTTA